MTSTTAPSFTYAHRGAGVRRPRTTTYVVLSTRRIVGAATVLAVGLSLFLVAAFVGGSAGHCRAVPAPTTSVEVNRLIRDGWTPVSGESLVAPGCADQH